MEKKRFTLDERIAYYEKQLEGNHAYERLCKLYAERDEKQFVKKLRSTDPRVVFAWNRLNGSVKGKWGQGAG